MADVYEDIKAHFEEIEGAEVNKGRGSQGIKFGNKMYVMFLKGDLLVKLSPKRVKEIIDEGLGLAYDPGTGTAMKDRVLIPASRADSWISLAEESQRHAMNS